MLLAGKPPAALEATGKSFVAGEGMQDSEAQGSQHSQAAGAGQEVGA